MFSIIYLFIINIINFFISEIFYSLIRLALLLFYLLLCTHRFFLDFFLSHIFTLRFIFLFLPKYVYFFLGIFLTLLIDDFTTNIIVFFLYITLNCDIFLFFFKVIFEFICCLKDPIVQEGVNFQRWWTLNRLWWTWRIKITLKTN